MEGRLGVKIGRRLMLLLDVNDQRNSWHGKRDLVKGGEKPM